jgi:hypothetical protein
MTALKAPLPDHLEWLTPQVEALVRPGAFVLHDKDKASPPGSTRTWGLPDVPMGRGWPEDSVISGPWGWNGSPYDGESFWLQLNLAEIPAEVRQPHWPKVGVVWVFLDLSDGWQTRVEYDPRPAETITWRPRIGKEAPAGSRWVLQDTLTTCTPVALPDIWWDYRDTQGLCSSYDDWCQNTYGGREPSDFQVGGWMHPIQGDCDLARQTLVCALERQPFGDSGAVYLHYSVERGFYAEAHTC